MKKTDIEIIKEIIINLSCDTNTVTQLCQDYSIGRSTFYKLVKADPELQRSLALARINQAWIYADQIIDLADGCGNDVLSINKARLAIDARKFLLARLTPQKQFEKLDLENDGKNEDGKYEKMINDAKGDANALSKIYEELIRQPAVLKGSKI